MIKSHHLFVLLIIVFFSNCSRNSERLQIKSSPLSIINNIKESKELLFSKLGKNIEIIQLDNECLMGKINKLVLSDSNYFALDIDQCSCLCSFDKNGKLIKKLDLKQDTKFQFDAISEMFIFENNLVVHDVAMKINFHLNESLEVVKTEKLPFMANAIFPFNNNWLVFLNYRQPEYENDFLIYNPENRQILKKYLPISKKEYEFIYDDRSTFNLKNESEVFFSKAFNDTIYSIDKDLNFTAVYYIDFGSSKIPAKYLEEIEDSMDLMQDFLERKYYFLYGNIHFINNSEILAQVQNGNMGRNILIDTKKNEAILFDKFKDDYITGLEFYSPILSNQNHFIFEMSSETLSNSSSLPEDIILRFNPLPENNFLLFLIEK